MTIYHRYLASFCAFAVTELLVLGVLPDPWHSVLAFFGVLAAFSFVIRILRCPRCDMNIGYGGHFKGFRFQRSFFDTHCNQCGEDLNK